MKKGGIVAIAIVAVVLVCGGFFLFSKQNSTPKAEDETLTEVEKLITKNLDTDYPATPREVVKLYNRIITQYYSATFEDDQLEELADQARILFDDELALNNPPGTYLASVEADIQDYKDASRVISTSNVCDSSDVTYLSKDDESLAYVSASYFIKEGNSTYSRTYETFVLRKDAEGKWKILGYYQTEGDTSGD